MPFLVLERSANYFMELWIMILLLRSSGIQTIFLTKEIFEVYLENLASDHVPSFATFLVDVVESALFQQNIKYSFNL